MALPLWSPAAWSQGGPDAGSSPDAAVGDAGTPGPCPNPEVVQGAVEADAKLRLTNECLPEELARLAAAVKMYDQCVGSVKPAKTWIFPVANVPPGEAIGGDGQGFVKNRGIVCYVTPWAGHPAHDLFVDDRYHKNLDKNGKPFPTLAVEDAFVMVAHDGWTPEDRSRGGNYVMLYLPGRKQVTYYAHLDKVLVKAGDKVSAGQVLGTIGRTGKNAVPRRSQTHLHFGLWDAESFRPVNSYPLLRAAKMLAVDLTAPSAPPPGSAASK
ncbi:MAG TPA: M23 family metallopeptidase [Myxococcales bacterium]